MSNLIFAAIMPHGDVIPDLGAPAAPLMQKTHEAMLEVGKRLAAARPDTIVIATPHGIRIEDSVCIALTERAAGHLEGETARLEMDVPIDRQLAWRIAEAAEASSVPVAQCVYGTSSGPASKIPLDWGALIPLWYLLSASEQTGREPQVIVVVPSRGVDGEALIEFGRAVSQAADQLRRRIAFIASCDWAHAQDANGPYGYHPDAAKYDVMVQDVIQRNDLRHFLTVDEQFIENAKPDGNWQCLMLAGALENSGLSPELLSYQCPTYFGMLVAAYG